MSQVCELTNNLERVFVKFSPLNSTIVTKYPVVVINGILYDCNLLVYDRVIIHREVAVTQ